MTLIRFVAALARNGVVGAGNRMPWRLPEDQRHFRALTLGQPVLMGRLTWDSLPERFRPLPGRRNLVLTRQPGWAADGAEPVHSVEEALQRVEGSAVLNVIGGAQLWVLALPRADELVLTEIEHNFDGDTHFPDWPRAQFDEVQRERHQAAAPNDFAFSFVTYRRRPTGCPSG